MAGWCKRCLKHASLVSLDSSVCVSKTLRLSLHLLFLTLYLSKLQAMPGKVGQIQSEG